MMTRSSRVCSFTRTSPINTGWPRQRLTSSLPPRPISFRWAGPRWLWAGTGATAQFSGADGLDFDVTVLPVGPKGHGARPDVGTTGLAIAADSPRKQQAWEFVKFVTGPIGQAVIAESGLFVPVLRC